MKAITRFEPALDFLPRSFEMARLLRHPAYDCFYLSLAERIGVPVITADQRLIRRIQGTEFEELALPLTSLNGSIH